MYLLALEPSRYEIGDKGWLASAASDLERSGVRVCLGNG
jgi:hypothetical protein